MRITGSQLKEVIETGLNTHRNHLTLISNKALQNFADSLNEIKEKELDLFCCFVLLILRADENAGPIIANLMKAVNTDLDFLHKQTFSNIGYFFDDFLRKEDLLKYFAEKNICDEEDPDEEC